MRRKGLKRAPLTFLIHLNEGGVGQNFDQNNLKTRSIGY
jgi:hypothetical protein